MSKDHICCCNCGKKILIGEAYPTYNHPEAPPVCFDCLPEKIKKELEKEESANKDWDNARDAYSGE